MKAKLLFASDTCPIGINTDPFVQGATDVLLGDLADTFSSADYRVINLECPLTDSQTPIPKVGPNLSAPTAAVSGFKAMGIDLVTLANNHIMDHGAEGLYSTLNALDNAGINNIGAGKNLNEAYRMQEVVKNGHRIGILALAEQEFNTATLTSPGSSRIDIIDFIRIMAAKRKELDSLIVILHAGSEHHPYPSPNTQRVSRFMVEQGASAVICQHTHCIGSMEIYKGAPIIYGQGNFLFDYLYKNLSWRIGILVLLTILDDGKIEPEIIPYKQNLGTPGVRRLDDDENLQVLEAFRGRSNETLDEMVVEQRWRDYCLSRRQSYMRTLRGVPGVAGKLLSFPLISKYLDTHKVQRQRLGVIRCESHREAIQTLLDQEQ